VSKYIFVIANMVLAVIASHRRWRGNLYYWQ